MLSSGHLKNKHSFFQKRLHQRFADLVEQVQIAHTESMLETQKHKQSRRRNSVSINTSGVKKQVKAETTDCDAKNLEILFEVHSFFYQHNSNLLENLIHEHIFEFWDYNLRPFYRCLEKTSWKRLKLLSS